MENLTRVGQQRTEAATAIARCSRSVDLPRHRDPADRFLAATAKVLDLTLVTADDRILASGDLALLPNR